VVQIRTKKKERANPAQTGKDRNNTNDQEGEKTMNKNIITSLMALVLLLAIETTQATHGRYGQITWTPLTGNTVEFTAQTAWRRSFPTGCVDPQTLVSTACTGPDGFPAIGDIVPALYALEFGDNTLQDVYSVVTSIDVDNDWMFLQGLETASLPAVDTSIEHTYAQAGSFTASFQGCCRIGRIINGNYHVNNPDGFYRVETVVNVGTGNSSPVSVLPPIQVCGINAVCSIPVPAADADGDALSFRLSTPMEASGFAAGFLQPGAVGSGAPNPATIDPSTGLYTWDTTGALTEGDVTTTNNLYSTQIMIEDAASRVALDFLIQLTEVDQIPPEFPQPDPDQDPVCGTTQVVTAGQTLQFDVDAFDPDPGDTVVLNVVGLPTGATMNPPLPISGNPVTSQFSWVPIIEQLGSYVINFFATSSGSGTGQTQCSATVEVTEVLFVDVDFSPMSDDVNPVNPNSKGLIAVVIPTSESFDASTVDASTVVVGVGGATPVHAGGHLEDFDIDGDLDLVIHVRVNETGVECGDTSLEITARTASGQAIAGINEITTVGCSK
jgi:hypothetical protein